MRATVENVPDAQIIKPTDALVRVSRACICGSDLWLYKAMEPTEAGVVMGHEAVGVVEAVGSEVRTVFAAAADSCFGGLQQNRKDQQSAEKVIQGVHRAC